MENKRIPSLSNIGPYADALKEIKARIRTAQTRALMSVNAEMVVLYWDVGRIIVERQKASGWGSGFLPRLARDLHNQLPEVKGFSERNLKLMTQFYREYPELPSIGQSPVAQLQQKMKAIKGQTLVAQIPWAHNVLLMQKVKNWSVTIRTHAVLAQETQEPPTQHRAD